MLKQWIQELIHDEQCLIIEHQLIELSRMTGDQEGKLAHLQELVEAMRSQLTAMDIAIKLLHEKMDKIC